MFLAIFVSTVRNVLDYVALPHLPITCVCVCVCLCVGRYGFVCECVCRDGSVCGRSKRGSIERERERDWAGWSEKQGLCQDRHVGVCTA